MSDGGGEDMKDAPGTGLCFRCEHRAEFLERGRQPRMECGMTTRAVCGCYMYRPCRPVVTVPLPGKDPRPRFAAAFISRREVAAGLADGMVLRAACGPRQQVALYWAPAKLGRRKGRRK